MGFVFQGFGKLFQTGIDEVGSHTVFGVESGVQLKVIGQQIRFVFQDNIQDSATAFLHVFGNAFSVGKELGFDFGKEQFQFRYIAFEHKMDLAYFFGVDDGRFKSAACGPEFGRLRGSSHYGTFLNRHRNTAVFAVNQEIGGNAKR